ncbi:glycosyltransferase [Mycolicibacterium sp. ND9-15]|uniref:glycosyltransferase n=1 Tax=Mycolicibacterium sp. ND9-15 TaxID=3042320 RepID=UPI002DD84D61|nr:glycosyltransferase [Mycolicibacterium sp. ND9-15]WSE56281.1 glycosyltransferase [Mycolicibacterium sp. ND9-15]
MRVVQTANFYGPRSGGLRTAADRLGAECCARGHDVYLVVPGARFEWQRLPSSVTRISLLAQRIPFTGGYRAVMPRPVTALEQLTPDAIEVSDRLTLRSLAAWERSHGASTVMISHETFGLSALESLACGTPAVVSRTSALTEVLDAGSGAVADKDPATIARAVTSVISRPESVRRRDARRRVEEFTWPRAASGMLRALAMR